MQHKHKKHQQQKAEPGSASPSVPSPGLFSPQSAAVAAPYSPVCSPQLRVPTTTPPRAACTAHWAVTTTTINRFPTLARAHTFAPFHRFTPSGWPTQSRTGPRIALTELARPLGLDTKLCCISGDHRTTGFLCMLRGSSRRRDYGRTRVRQC